MIIVKAMLQQRKKRKLNNKWQKDCQKQILILKRHLEDLFVINNHPENQTMQDIYSIWYKIVLKL